MMDLNDLDEVKHVDSKQLRSFAQSTREADLGRTRNILLIIGVLSLALNGYMYANSRDEVAKLGLDPTHGDRVLIIVRVIYEIGMALGAFFTVAGILVKKYPVPLTVLSLILYVGSIVGFGMLDSGSLMRGIIIKIIIVISLANAVRTARDYQNAKEDLEDE